MAFTSLGFLHAHYSMPAKMARGRPTTNAHMVNTDEIFVALLSEINKHNTNVRREYHTAVSKTKIQQKQACSRTKKSSPAQEKKNKKNN